MVLGSDPLINPDHAALHTQATLSGTTFPASPSVNDRFFRTDRDILYYWDGTNWLSVTLYNDPMPTTAALPLTATTTGHRHTAPWAGVYQLWLLTFQATFHVVAGTALSASHKWVCTLTQAPGGPVVAITIDSGAVDTWRNSGAVAVNGVIATTVFAFDVPSVKTGTPGNLFIMPRITYRLIG